MTGKILRITLCIFMVTIFLICGIDKGYSQTTNLTTLTNYATVTGANIPTQTVGVKSNVFAIIGGCWLGEDDITNAQVAGASYTNTTHLTNLGNYVYTFDIGVSHNYVTSGTPWRWTFYTNNSLVQACPWTYGVDATAFQMSFEYGEIKDIDFVVYITNIATESTQGWCLIATRSGPPIPENTTNYRGDNLVWYGGAPNVGWADGIDANALNILAGDCQIDSHNDGDYYFSIYISSPNIMITKSIASVQLNSVDSQPIPGATITFEIIVTNDGATANEIIVIDYLDTSYMLYVGGSQSVVAGWNEGYQAGAGPSGEDVLSWTNQSPFAGGEGFHFTFEATIR